MSLDDKTLMICDCEGTMPLDAKALSKALGTADLQVNTQLCRKQIENFLAAAKGEAPVVVACTQESPLFEETAAEAASDADLTFANIRERAGWSKDAKAATPKIMALLEEATLDAPGTPAVTLVSEGAVLIYGAGEAYEAAQQLAAQMDVTCILTDTDGLMPPRLTEFVVYKGKVETVSGHLGAFQVQLKGAAASAPSSRGEFAFEPAAETGEARFDIVLDLSGGTPMVTAPEKRDGYFNPDPKSPVDVQRAIFEASGLVGEFEKPRYVKFDETLCVHSRNHQTGCTRCLDVCPAGAITSNGDVVEIDPYICGGCGGCGAVCPTGASTYDLPAENFIFTRLRSLLGTYSKHGGKAPVLLVHDTSHGEDMISAIARAGKGLPANVIPFAVNEVTQVGFDIMAAALAYGASQIRLLANPRRSDELDGLKGQIELIEAAMDGLGYDAGRVVLIDEADPDAVEAALYGTKPMKAPEAGSFLVMGGKRSSVTVALQHLYRHAPKPQEIVPLTEGAPFGDIEVRADGCTLCLACVSVCPTGALGDNEDTPELSFTENACVQCGLCRTTCPEKVITLAPRFNFAEAAMSPVVKNAEEPMQCVRCGAPFGVKSSVERMVEKLRGHSMYAEDGALDRIRMCMDCRVLDQWQDDDHMAGTIPRRPTRTTDDYLDERKAADASKGDPPKGDPPKGDTGKSHAGKTNGAGNGKAADS